MHTKEASACNAYSWPLLTHVWQGLVLGGPMMHSKEAKCLKCILLVPCNPSVAKSSIGGPIMHTKEVSAFNAFS